MLMNQIRYRIRTPEVVYETIEGETVIVNLENGIYYSLSNQIGADTWTLIESGMDFPLMCSAISSHYNQEETLVVEHLREFVILLQQEGLIEADQHPVLNSNQIPTLLPLPLDQIYEPPKIERFSDMQDLLLLDPIHDVDEAGWPNLPKPPE